VGAAAVSGTLVYDTFAAANTASIRPSKSSGVAMANSFLARVTPTYNTLSASDVSDCRFSQAVTASWDSFSRTRQTAS